MRKLTDTEFSEINPSGKGKTSPFFLAIIGLKKGEGVFISKAEWNLGQTPGRICCYIMKKYPRVKYDYGMKHDKTGWIIKRIE